MKSKSKNKAKKSKGITVVTRYGEKYTIVDDMPDLSNDPYFKAKRERFVEFIKKAGIPDIPK